MLNMQTMLKLLPAIGATAARLPEFKALWDQGVKTFSAPDQAQLKEAYGDLIADNDEGHRRLQEKLKAAAAG